MMMHVLHKTYEITVTIAEGSDEFWESFSEKTGCDEVVAAIQSALDDHGFHPPDCSVRLSKFWRQ